VSEPRATPTPAAAAAPRSGVSADGRTPVLLVPHTHWDREWYQPFQVFRMRLVELVDQLLETMAADPDLRFTLDGQVATVDDYLEVRPAARSHIEALVREGRLAIGPWQILSDEFLVSGETLVRNLELGWHAAQRYGAAMPIGYLPDMFGHIAQMPQILRRAGIGHAVVWRGVPAAVDHHAFDWSSPDGSTVRTEYLPGGYGNAAYLLAVPERLPPSLARFVDAHRPIFGDGGVLAMYGTDHAVPSPRLTALIASLNASQDRATVRVVTLPEAIAALAAADDPSRLPRWTGELRSGARANMLMGVTSARMDLRVAAARAERELERYAEPLAALHGGAWPERLLELAWRRVVDNSAHDSICGCSHDEVVDQVLVRYAEATQIATGITGSVTAALARRVPRGSFAVVNPSPSERAPLVELEVDAPDAWRGLELELPDGRRLPTQRIASERRLMPPFALPPRDIPHLFARRLHGRELFGRSLDGFRVEHGPGGHRLLLLLDDPSAPDELDMGELLDSIEEEVGRAPAATWEVVPVAGDRRTIVAAVPVPPLGWTAVRPAQGEGGEGTGVASDQEVRAGSSSIENGLVSVGVAPDGTLRIDGADVSLTGVGRIVDGGDFGDTYNHAPPARDQVVETPLEVRVVVLEEGPLRGRLEVLRTYRWPAGVLPDGSARTDQDVAVEVATTVELQVGEPFVRLRVAFENPSRDHRVRCVVPLPAAADHSAAEGQFAVVERSLAMEGGHGEVPLPTYPARGFVHARGVTVLLDHVTEYELVDQGRELALTLLRSTGLISRNENPWREDPAGPEVPVRGAQMLGPWSMGFAIMPHARGWPEAGVLDAWERYAHPPRATRGLADARTPLSTSMGLRLEGAGVVLSSLRRRDAWVEARLVAQHPEPTLARVTGAFSEAREVDLLGRPGVPLPMGDDGALSVSLRPWEIRTIQLR
jgi:mannosylglycerate hydrolase